MKRFLIAPAIACAVVLFGAPASAAPIGTLSTTACIGTGVTVTFTMVDWLPSGGGSGCIDTVVPTNITYTGPGGLDVLGAGQTGTILDLTVGGLPVNNFMTFTGETGLHFDLLSVAPGVANTACPDVFDENAPDCSVVGGSPFVLESGLTGTTVKLAVSGLAGDALGLTSWIGLFSVVFAGETPQDLQARFLTTGSITSGHNGSFVTSPIPEPATLLLFGTGLAVTAARARSRRRREN